MIYAALVLAITGPALISTVLLAIRDRRRLRAMKESAKATANEPQ